MGDDLPSILIAVGLVGGSAYILVISVIHFIKNIIT